MPEPVCRQIQFFPSVIQPRYICRQISERGGLGAEREVLEVLFSFCNGLGEDEGNVGRDNSRFYEDTCEKILGSNSQTSVMKAC